MVTMHLLHMSNGCMASENQSRWGPERSSTGETGTQGQTSHPA